MMCGFRHCCFGCQLKTMIGAGKEVKFCRNARANETACIRHVFFGKKIERTNSQIGAGKALKVGGGASSHSPRRQIACP